MLVVRRGRNESLTYTLRLRSCRRGAKGHAAGFLRDGTYASILPVERDQALECTDLTCRKRQGPTYIPNHCPNCGRAANTTLPRENLITRNFREHSDDRVLVRFDVPYCQECASAHKKESQPRRRPVLRRVLLRGGAGIYLLLVGIVLGLIAWFDPSANGHLPDLATYSHSIGCVVGCRAGLCHCVWETRYLTRLPPRSVRKLHLFEFEMSSQRPQFKGERARKRSNTTLQRPHFRLLTPFNPGSPEVGCSLLSVGLHIWTFRAFSHIPALNVLHRPTILSMLVLFS